MRECVYVVVPLVFDMEVREVRPSSSHSNKPHVNVTLNSKELKGKDKKTHPSELTKKWCEC